MRRSEEDLSSGDRHRGGAIGSGGICSCSQDAKYPTIAKQWRLKWADIITLFEFPSAIRKAIYTTNAIESVNSVIRKFTRNRKIYPNADSALKIVHMAIQEAAKKWTMPVRNWKEALNHFAILYEGRMPALTSN